MSRLEPAETIEQTVGATRHATEHIGRAVSWEKCVYVLHSAACIEAHAADGTDLRDCLFSLALDEGIDLDIWYEFQDVPVILGVDEECGDLAPLRVVAP